MLRISSAALLLFGTGFLQILLSIASKEVEEGQSVTMWCSHDISVAGYLYWFKQTDGVVPINIVHMIYTESLQKTQPNYFNNYTEEHLVMNLFSKNTSLTIKKVSISDSGFYFCGATGYYMKFGKGTRLEVKARDEKQSLNTIAHGTTVNVKSVSISEKNDKGASKKGHDKSAVSTEECSRDVFFTLTFIFGGIIVLTCIIPLVWGIIREHKRQQKHKKAVVECQAQQHDDKENDSVEYAAVNFRRPKPAGRHTEDTVAVYTDTWTNKIVFH